MKIYIKSVFLVLTGSALAGAAIAQVPSTNDTSDRYFNTGSGTDALFSVTPNTVGCGESGTCNTAAGYKALYANTVGFINTAVGVQSLYENTSGDNNTALGYNSLYSNTIGEFETAIGVQALYSNTRSQDNTALGYDALYSNTTGFTNTAVGANVLAKNTTGSGGTGAGEAALANNAVGVDNTAVGFLALNTNIANDNTAIGTRALYLNKAGAGNTASGYGALFHNTSGHYNIAEGYNAGYNLTTGNYNIDVGNMGVAAEAGVIRIGTSGQQTQAVIAGIESSQVTGAAVYVTPAGQLGVLASSERFKTAVTPMGSGTSKLGELRPVSFKLKNDGTGTRQYGLIAEEVAKIYPELVIHDAAGRISGVRYDELAPMLLNQTQKRLAELEHLKQQESRTEQQMSVLIALNQKLERALARLQTPKGNAVSAH